MPHFTVHLLEETLDSSVERQVIEALTDAVVGVYGAQARQLVVVELFGVPRGRWGVGGVAIERIEPVVTLTMREPALHRATIDDVPARLIESITDAMTDVFGPDVRDHVHVQVVGIPTGRSGIGGAVV
jgi:phenylpyruvate tautomerase PptA (4-oxalocrotonate tautomerase family)